MNKLTAAVAMSILCMRFLLPVHEAVAAGKAGPSLNLKEVGTFLYLCDVSPAKRPDLCWPYLEVGMQAAMLNGAAFGAFQQNEGLSPNQGSMRALRAFSILQGCPNGKVATSGEILPIVISRIKAAHYDPSYQSGYAIMKALAQGPICKGIVQ